MLDLTDMQAKMIKVFIEHYRDELNQISKGISADELEKYGIVSKTFRNHKEYFLKNYFLRLNTVGYHYNRNHFYFQITRLGVLAYLKWQSKSEPSDIWLDRDFFPDLHKYWVELVESFEQVLIDVLRKTLERIEIRPEFEGKIHGETIFGGKLDESIKIPMGMVEVKIFRKYKQPDMQENPTTKNWGVSETFESLNPEIDDKITQRFTFLLLFNLLHIGTSAGEFTNLIMQNYIKFVDDNEIESIEKNKEEDRLIAERFHKRLQENITKLYSIINKDETLHSLMKSTISEIIDMLANRKTVQAIYEKLD